ncbi:MAG TPA: tRNA uridine-5-carboxymethylaminomethyl(34) synthesis GTPase MnmE [Gammaproteobacteria bacterium]|nr:tRNA uridine-5-carboxymethylaminomethyl(34) synthesis GTPase MnmE [Gammaproteobacteria bacterium]
MTTSDTTDTIAAVATPPGRGGVGIVRVSGPAASAIATAVLGQCPPPRHAAYLPFRDEDGRILDHGIALYFPGPHSFTGEDVLELQGHGGPVVLDMLLRRTLALGARPARPGEFSERAFLNGKLDLAQAEAVADLIDSASEAAARSALRSLEGEFSRRIHALVEAVTALRVYVEGAIDFPEEEIDFLTEGEVSRRLQALRNELSALQDEARQGCLLREGMRVVITGRPNAGKSSLLNLLARREAAIVTDIPGTTRDVLREAINLDGLPLHLSDTAGLRDSDDPVERLGVARAREEIGTADRILLVMDDREAEDLALLDEGVPPERLTVVHNKIDLTGHAPGLETAADGHTRLWLSARTGAGLDLLCRHLKAVMGYHHETEGGFMARRRHLDALRRAGEHLAAGHHQLETQRAGELLAEDLRQAQQALGEITGEVSSDDLLGRIFSEFCIGK